jgi:hypothetical protein
MPLIKDVLMQLGKSSWFSTFNLQLKFGQINMADEDICKTVVITKFKLFEWNVIPFGLKNTTNVFSRTMA